MDRNRYQGVENPSHKKLKQILGKTKRFDSFQVNLNQSKTMEMGGPGKGVFRMYDHQKKLSSSKPSRNKPSSSKPSAMPSRYLRMQDEEIHVEEPRHSFSPPQSHGRRVRTRNHDEEYLQEHDHEGEISCSLSPPQSHGRRVRIRNQNEEYQQEQDYEGDSVQTGMMKKTISVQLHTEPQIVVITDGRYNSPELLVELEVLPLCIMGPHCNYSSWDLN